MTGNRNEESAEESQQLAECYVCGGDVDVREDEWWQHSWEENPSKENVEKAIEETEFRDWFRENKVFCKDCHKLIIDEIEYYRGMSGQ